MIPTVHESRKITGLVVVIAALLVVLVVGTLAIAIWGVDWQYYAAMGGQVLGIGGLHQGSQAAQDRAQAYSPNYPAPGQTSQPPPTNFTPPPTGNGMQL